MASTFVEYDIRKPIENLPFTPTEDDVIFNFAAVHRTPGHEDYEYFETNIRGHKFAYPGSKDTIKACIYVKELVRFMLYRLEHHEHGVELYNCCFEPAYTIQHIVEAMKKVTGLTQFVPDIPNWVIMPMARAAMLLGSPMGICPARVKKLQISTNICGEKLKNCGYQFKWSFEEALADWFEDNDRKYLK